MNATRLLLGFLVAGVLSAVGCYNTGELGDTPFLCADDPVNNVLNQCPDGYFCDLPTATKPKGLSGKCASKGKCVCAPESLLEGLTSAPLSSDMPVSFMLADEDEVRRLLGQVRKTTAEPAAAATTTTAPLRAALPR